MSITFSIDPGKNGAVVLWSGEEIIAINNLEYTGARINLLWLKEIFQDHTPRRLVIEDVHVSPRMGVTSAGNFMYSLGAIHAAAAMTGTEIIRITPQKWKVIVGLYERHKGAALIKVGELLPPAALDLINGYKNSLDRAEAALIGVASTRI